MSGARKDGAGSTDAKHSGEIDWLCTHCRVETKQSFKPGIWAGPDCSNTPGHNWVSRTGDASPGPYGRAGSAFDEDNVPMPRTSEAVSGPTSAAPKRVEFWRIRPVEGGAWLYETKLANLVDLIESETSENHALVLEKTSLTEEEAANMGEFDGW
jgi:hypothetical protein